MKQVFVDSGRITSYPRLEVLKIASQCFSAQVCRFVYQKLTRFRVLKLVSINSDVNDMSQLMTGLQKQKIRSNISIHTLVFKHFDAMSTKFLYTLPNYFTFLKNIGFKDCAFNGF